MKGLPEGDLQHCGLWLELVERDYFEDTPTVQVVIKKLLHLKHHFLML
jgi:hypothetical protein